MHYESYFTAAATPEVGLEKKEEKSGYNADITAWVFL